MNKIIDFTNCKRVHRAFGWRGKGIGVEYNGDVYLLKFSESRPTPEDIAAGTPNNIISEYISSQIVAMLDIPTQETVLGTYNGEVVLACKDFRDDKTDGYKEYIGFDEYLRACYYTNEIWKNTRTRHIYGALSDPVNAIPEALQDAAIDRFWDMFVADALVGNAKRNMSNWGFLAKNGTDLSLAPVHDFWNTLFPELTENEMEEIISDEFKLLHHTLVTPSAALSIGAKKSVDLGYYDMMSAMYDHECTDAVLRICPMVDLNKINAIIDDTPLISDRRKEFYKKLLKSRKEWILNRSHMDCWYEDRDSSSFDRIEFGKFPMRL